MKNETPSFHDQIITKHLFCLLSAGLYLLFQKYAISLFNESNQIIVHFIFLFMIGIFMGWLLNKIGYVFGLYLFCLGGVLGYFKIRPFWSHDVGWVMVLILNGMPTIIFCSFGVVCGIWFASKLKGVRGRTWLYRYVTERKKAINNAQVPGSGE